MKVGQFVEVRYTEAGGAKVATEIRPLAAEEESASKEKDATVAGNTSAHGTVVSVAADSIVINADGADVKFTVTSKTKVLGTGMGTKTRELQAAGKPAVITAFIGPKDQVVVYYTEAATSVATSIRVIREGRQVGPGRSDSTSAGGAAPAVSPVVFFPPVSGAPVRGALLFQRRLRSKADPGDIRVFAVRAVRRSGLLGADFRAPGRFHLLALALLLLAFALEECGSRLVHAPPFVGLTPTNLTWASVTRYASLPLRPASAAIGGDRRARGLAHHPPPGQPLLDVLHVDVEDRRDEERQRLREEQPAHDREPERPPRFRARAESQRDRQRAHQRRHRRHHDRAEPHAGTPRRSPRPALALARCASMAKSIIMMPFFFTRPTSMMMPTKA